MKSRLILLLGMLIVGCESGERQSFTKKIVYDSPLDTLTSDSVYVGEDITIFNQLSIHNINDEYLAIIENREYDFLKIFSLPDLNFLYKWGAQGRGPDEFMSPPRYVNVNGKFLYLYQGMLRDMKAYEVLDSTLIYNDSRSFTVSDLGSSLNRIRRLNDTLYIADYGTGISAKEGHEYIAINSEIEDSIFTFSPYPESEFQGPERYQEFLKSNISKPDGSRFAAFYFFKNMFKIYDNKGKLVQYVNVERPPSSIIAHESDDIMYRIAAHASDEFIYTLGFYAPNEVIYSDSPKDFNSYFEVWSWSGDLIYRAVLDRLIHNFTISERNNEIYGYSLLNDDYLYKYNTSIEGKIDKN